MPASSEIDLPSKRDALLGSWQYIASEDFSSYAHWEPLNPTSNELRDAEDNPATIVIVGQVVTDKLMADPLGNYQSQGERQSRYQDSSKNFQDMSCVNAKQVIVIRRPTAHIWRTDFEAATDTLNALQEKVANTNAPRQHLLDKDQSPPFVRMSFPLWEKKKYISLGKHLDDPVEEEDDVIRSLCEDHDYRDLSKQTAEYGSYLPDSYIDAFRSTAKTHHVRIIPVFLPNGKRVSTVELPIRLENALVEVMFSLKHYYYGPSTANKFKQTKVGNTYTATIEQVSILQVNSLVSPSHREPTMRTIQTTPASKKGKSPKVQKRPSSRPPDESSPSSSKKKKTEEATPSSSTISPTEDDSAEDEVLQALA